jgi:2-polyprenyl-3-methyl-5-hydroxy-6-metoxy-1,4-benzoquinol methylase
MQREEVILNVPTRELIARQSRQSGFARMDIVIMYLAIRKRGDGLALFEKLLNEDSLRPSGDHALFAALHTGSFGGGPFIPRPVQIDGVKNMTGECAGLAIALSQRVEEVAVTLKGPASPMVCDISYLARHNFSGNEIAALEAVKEELFQELQILPLAWNDIQHKQKALSKHIDPHDVMHGRGSFYQSCEELFIIGQRPTVLRFNTYELASVLDRSHRVLDIGCNCGFFSIHVAKFVTWVDAFDINPRFIAIANDASRFLNVKNCSFVLSTFNEFDSPWRYDVVISSAVHHWIGLPLNEYAEKLKTLIRPGGILLFESQDLADHDADWDAKLEHILRSGFEIVRSGGLCDDGLLARKYALLRDTRSACNSTDEMHGRCSSA